MKIISFLLNRIKGFSKEIEEIEKEPTYGLRIISKYGGTIRITNRNRNAFDEISIWFTDSVVDSFNYSEGVNSVIVMRENIDHIIVNKL